MSEAGYGEVLFSTHAALPSPSGILRAELLGKPYRFSNTSHKSSDSPISCIARPLLSRGFSHAHQIPLTPRCLYAYMLAGSSGTESGMKWPLTNDATPSIARRLHGKR